MASWPHLQAAAISTRQTHGPHDRGAGWEPQLHLYHWQRQTEQVIQERHPGGPGTPSVQHPISDLPNTVTTMYAYADDLAIMHADGDWQAVEEVLSEDMATLVNTSRPAS